MVRTIYRSAVALTLTALTAGAALAQGRGMPGHRMAGQHAMQGGPAQMLPALAAFQPRLLLDRVTELGLSTEQVERLEALASEAETLVAEAQQTHQEYREAMMQEATRAAPDESRIAEAFWGAHAAMGKQHWAATHAALGAKAVLTPDQRTRVETEF